MRAQGHSLGVLTTTSTSAAFAPAVSSGCRAPRCNGPTACGVPLLPLTAAASLRALHPPRNPHALLARADSAAGSHRPPERPSMETRLAGAERLAVRSASCTGPGVVAEEELGHRAPAGTLQRPALGYGAPSPGSSGWPGSPAGRGRLPAGTTTPTPSAAQECQDGFLMVLFPYMRTCTAEPPARGVADGYDGFPSRRSFACTRRFSAAFRAK